MTTIAQTIAARHLEGGGGTTRHSTRGKGMDVAKGVALFFAAPFIGLGYSAVYALVGFGAIACYGLKAVGIRCGVFRD